MALSAFIQSLFVILSAYCVALFNEAENEYFETFINRTVYITSYYCVYGSGYGRLGRRLGYRFCSRIWYCDRPEKCTKRWGFGEGNNWNLWCRPIEWRLEPIR